MYLLALLIAVLGGGAPVLVKLGMLSMTPLGFTLVRYVLASLAIVGAWRLFGTRSGFRADPWLICAATAGHLGNVLFFAVGIRSVSVTFSQILYLLTPLLVYLSAVIFLRERLSKRGVWGIAIGACGAFFSVFSRGALSASAGGTLLILGGVLSHTTYLLFSRKLTGVLSPLEQTVVVTVLSALVLAFLCPLIDTPFRVIPATGREWGAVMYLGFIGSALYYLLVQHLVRHASAVAASIPLYLQPIAAAVWSSFFFEEHFNLWFILSGVVTMLGAYLVSTAKALTGEELEV